MRYNQCRDLRVSEVGVGCYSLAGVYGKKDLDEFARMVRRAYELGVTFFDTADAYGDAESILGKIVRDFRSDIYIATKVGVVSGASMDLSPARVKRACEESLARLGTDYIDLYQVHFDDPKTPVEDVVGALESLVASGKIRHYGVGHLPADKIARYAEVGRPLSVLMELSAATRDARAKLLPLCREHGMAAIAFSTTGRGILTGTIREGHVFPDGDIRQYDPLFQREQFRSALRVAGRVAEVGRRYGKTPAQTAIAWVLAQPAVVCALTGPSNVSHLEENVGGSGWRISNEDLASFEAFLSEEDARLDRERKEAVVGILSSPLPADPQAAFKDLVYAIDTAAVAGMCAEAQIVPVFEELLALQKAPGEQAAGKLDDIRRRLAAMVSGRP
ncbi:MAG: aldo/keto reductase [Firmicutes bacterium]|nr:aldo/keto reductase [Bacillota bacterium]